MAAGGSKRRNFPRGRRGGKKGVDPGFQKTVFLSPPYLRRKLATGKPQTSFAPWPAPGPGLSTAPRCHYTSRDPRPGPVLPEASLGVLIKGHNKTDLPAHQKKCPPGK